MEKITSFAHACKVLKRDPKKLPDVSMLPRKDCKAFVSLYKLTTIIEATNKLTKWKPDWSDSNQGKYCPWFYMNKVDKSGSGLAYLDYRCANSLSSVGSRLVVGTAEMAKYIGEKFIDLYSDWFL